MGNQDEKIKYLQKILDINYDIIPKLVKLGILKDEVTSVRDYNVGKSNYNTHIIQPWAIWMDYPELTPWDTDIIKRILRTKEELGLSIIKSRELDYKKIIHICNERLRQLGYDEEVNNM